MDEEWDRSSSRTGSVNIHWCSTVVISIDLNNCFYETNI